MKIVKHILFAFSITAIIACGKYDCTFIQDDETADGWYSETEIAILNDCLRNQFTLEEDIQQNLIGEWELIGHAMGWALPISLPCAHIIITEDELTFTYEDADVDEVTDHTWKIIQSSYFGTKIFKINVEPRNRLLEMHTFCTEYMFQDNTPNDGNMYLYQKIE